MSMATGTAIALGSAAIAGGATIAAAKMGSNAAHDAAATQAASGQKALDLQKSIYDQQQQNLAPYRQAGNVGLASLTSRVQNPGTLSASGNGWVSSGGQPAEGSSTGTPSNGAPMGLASMTSGNGNVAGISGRMVMMRSPDGTTTKAVPEELVDHYRQQGATLVAGGGAGAGTSALPKLGTAA